MMRIRSKLFFGPFGENQDIIGIVKVNLEKEGINLISSYKIRKGKDHVSR